MTIARRQILVSTFQLFDILIFAFAFLLGVFFSCNGQQELLALLKQILSTKVSLQNLALFCSFILTWHLTLFLCGLYYSRRISTTGQEIADVAKATSLGTLIIFSAATLWFKEIATIAFLAPFWSVATGSTIASRIVLRYALKQIRLRGRNLRHILIIGTNRRAVRVARIVERSHELGYRLIGFMDQDWDGMEEFRQSGFQVVANIDEFLSYVRNNIVDEVLVCLPFKSFYERNYQIVSSCEEQGIIVRLLPDFFDLNLGKFRVEQIEDLAIITVYTSEMRDWQRTVKHAFDSAAALLLLLVTLPVMLLTAVAVKLSSPGPLFFVQERVGLNKRRFKLYKFRTMVRDAEKMLAELELFNEMDGPVFKIKDDPRITPLGRVLRKTSLDELPQLFNVLNGDMSLVGPRPLPVRDYEGFDQDWNRRRFSVRPGITCLWQISGRNHLSFEEWMRLDMSYVDRWSLWLDIKILAKTIPAVLRGTGAS